MEIRKVKENEFKQLMESMNYSFGFTEETSKFETFLPKLYYKYQEDAIHIAAFDNEKIVAAGGLYLNEFSSPTFKIKTGCIGGVGTNREYRKQGIFTSIMESIIEEAKKMNLDLLYLSGNRARYNHFGFETGGARFNYTINRRSKKIQFSENVPYFMKPLEEESESIIQECLNLYNQSYYHGARSLENFVRVLKSWNCIPYAIYKENQFIGYYAINNKTVFEFIAKENYYDDCLQAFLKEYSEVKILADIDFYNTKTLNLCDSFGVNRAALFLVLNKENVLKYLNIDPSTIEHYNTNDTLSLIEFEREIFGDGYTLTKKCKPIYVFEQDMG